MTQSGVSTAVGRLDDQLGVRLLARTTRNVNLTDDGAAFLDRCRQILEDLEDAERVLTQARLKPTGGLGRGVVLVGRSSLGEPTLHDGAHHLLSTFWGQPGIFADVVPVLRESLRFGNIRGHGLDRMNNLLKVHM